jgi:hypothetical protein
MLNPESKSELSQIVAVAYFSNYVDPDGLKKLQKFLREHGIGHHRWGKLYRYHKVELDHIDDLTSLLKKFPRLIEGYKDLSDCPERPD